MATELMKFTEFLKEKRDRVRRPSLGDRIRQSIKLHWRNGRRNRRGKRELTLFVFNPDTDTDLSIVDTKLK